MKTIQMTLDDDLVSLVDKAARRLKTSRSAFTRQALRSALEQLRVQELERRHREGYAKKPSKKGEFDAWEREQVWGDYCDAGKYGDTNSPLRISAVPS